ncbi:MAG TPA: purine nucleoside permease [Kofleriaceae bacterium]|jgi:purine nucleoside permease|nr:purine nucleoside permease [Kofleriaceae bacterium]
MRSAIALALLSLLAASARPPGPAARQVKVLVIAPTPGELAPWISHFGLTSQLAMPGLSPSSPSVSCNADSVCAVATGAGKANAAATIAALAYGGQLDLSATYFVIAELARIDPAQGTIDSAVWIGDAVDAGIAWEIDARTLPSSWTTGYLGIDATDPTQAPPVPFGTEHYTLDGALVAKAIALAGSATLEDTDAARAYRAMYGSGAAIGPPSMLHGATASSDTVWHGALLGQRARDWVGVVAGSGATYATMQQNDNATLAALTAASHAGLLDATRVAVLHAAFAFDRPYPSQTAYDSLMADPGARASSLDNLVTAGAPLVADIVANWSEWASGVPQ